MTLPRGETVGSAMETANGGAALEDYNFCNFALVCARASVKENVCHDLDFFFTDKCFFQKTFPVCWFGDLKHLKMDDGPTTRIKQILCRIAAENFLLNK